MITVKVTNNETGEVLFETNEATGIMGVVALPDRAQGVCELINSVGEIFTMFEVLNRIKESVFEEHADVARYAEYRLTNGSPVIINEGEEQ